MRTLTIDEKMSKAVALYKEPLEGFTPNDIRQWLLEHNSDDDFATAYALVANQAGWLMHDIGDPDNSEEEDKRFSQLFDEWWALDGEILQIIIGKIKEYNAQNGTSYPTEGKGTHFIVEPFMNMHGYRDGAGWWVEKEPEDEEP